jgi:aspartate-semialdehyde dehydrogenase
VFFSTSQAGQAAPDVGRKAPPVGDARDIEALRAMDAILTTQGGDYTESVYPALRQAGWDGYWIDAASTLRMADDSVIVLDPVNGDHIEASLDGGVRASGSGAQHMRELIAQMGELRDAAGADLEDPAAGILAIDSAVSERMRAEDFPTDHFEVPLAGSLIPWIDKPMDTGQSKEEWKGSEETNKILGRQDTPLPIDGTCVRIGAMRSHAQAFTIKLARDVPMDEVTDMISRANEWVRVVPNEPEASKTGLSPAAVTGTMEVPVGRLRKMRMGDDFLNAFSVGDQLLWGAAEPLRRTLRILLEAE